MKVPYLQLYKHLYLISAISIPPPPPVALPLPRPVCLNGEPPSHPCLDPNECEGLTFCHRGGCCPMPICPSRLPATQYCDPVTPCLAPGYICLGNGCCPNQPLCPLGERALSLCAGPGSCGEGLYCFIDINREQGCCPVPVCPNGQAAVAPCDGAPAACPSGTTCINGGCCPIPMCSSGAPGISSCVGYGQSSCSPGFNCQNSVCCPNPTCGDGQSSVPSCNYGQCSGGGVCDGDVCCPLPTCPDGQLALVSCFGAGQATCPLGYQCFGNGCCALPSCPDGTIGIQSCKGYGLSTCPLSYDCLNEVCCRSESTNRCPNGGLGGSYCLSEDQCGPGYECVGGTCCFLSRCPDGQLPDQPCGPYGQCGLGFFCIQGQCCQQMLPICPSGQRAAQTCLGIGQGTCAYGFQCFNGGCCPAAIAPPLSICPAPQQPICYCAAYNYACPESTACHMGSCCASQGSPLFNTVGPGARCLSQTQCPGQFSVCINGYCSCVE
uniref:Uncharacterized protein n=1 Tax=Plectus sambesii TaxID=2011161 RepID=A0A914X7A0_9BILA